MGRLDRPVAGKMAQSGLSQMHRILRKHISMSADPFRRSEVDQATSSSFFKNTRLLALALVLPWIWAAPVCAGPIAPVTYAFVGTFNTVSSTMDFLMPGLAEGATFSGTMALSQYADSQTIWVADLHVESADHIITARSLGFDPLWDFAQGRPNAALGSPTLQNGFISGLFFTFQHNDPSLGTLGVFATGTRGDGVIQGAYALGDIQGVTTVPEPVTGLLSLLGLGVAALRGRRLTAAVQRSRARLGDAGLPSAR